METLRYVLLANGLLAVVVLAYYGLLRRETFFGANRAALWLGLAASVGLPLVELPDYRPEPVRVVMQQTAQRVLPKLTPSPPVPDVTITYPNQRTYRALTGTPHLPGWAWQNWLLLTYSAVVMLLLARFGVQLWSLRRLLRQSAHERYDDFVLVLSRTVASPFSFFRYVVVNPAQHTSDELEQILQHERVHVRERHSIDMVAAELLCIIGWFNPAVYLFRHLLQQTLEFQADRAVLAEGVDARAYQYNLVKVSLSANQPGLTSSFSKSFLKPRIAMINQPKSSSAIWLKYPVFMLGMLTVATLFARPKAATLAKYMPRPVAEVVAEVMQTERVEESSSAGVDLLPFKPVRLERELVAEESSVLSLTTDTIQEPATVSNSESVSPSRYLFSKGGLLYWVVTPKTSFNDLAIIKRELEAHGQSVLVHELKYDPLNAYITRVNIAVNRPSGGGVQFDDLQDNNQAITSHGGYIGIAPNSLASGVTDAPLESGSSTPTELQRVVRDDEAAVALFIKANRTGYLLHEGKQMGLNYGKTNYILSGDIRRGLEHNKKRLAIRTDSEEYIQLTETSVDKPLFINNQPATAEAIARLKLNQIAAIMTVDDPNKGEQPGATKAFFFYTKDSK